MKKLIVVSVSLVCAVAVYFTVNANPKNASSLDLMTQNVEALARGESGSVVTCKAPWDPYCTSVGNVDVYGTKQ